MPSAPPGDFERSFACEPRAPAPAAGATPELSSMSLIRHDWTAAEIRSVYDTPLLQLVFRAAAVHREHHDPAEMQVCKLISIKTGACPEDCSYCSQSSRYQTDI